MRHTGLTSKRSSQEQARALEGKEEEEEERRGGIEGRGAEKQAAMLLSSRAENQSTME